MLNCRYVLELCSKCQSQKYYIADILGKVPSYSSSSQHGLSSGLFLLLLLRLVPASSLLTRGWGVSARTVFNHIKCITCYIWFTWGCWSWHWWGSTQKKGHKSSIHDGSIWWRNERGRDLISGEMFRSVAQSSKFPSSPTPELMRIILLQESPGGI